MDRTFWDWITYIVETYWPLLLRGTGVTMMIAVVGTAIGFCIGLVVGAIRVIPLERPGQTKLSPRTALLKLINGILYCYVEMFRGTPMIVQATIVYYGLMEVLNIDLAPLNAALWVVSLNTGAYMSEIVRGGIHSIDRGQTEAAKAIGMTHWKTMFHVILPQAIRNILPATGNELIINIKDTAVLNVISVGELYFAAKTIKGVNLRTYEVFLVVGIIYLILTISCTRLLRYLERRIDGPDSYTLITSSTMPEPILQPGTRGRKGGRG